MFFPQGLGPPWFFRWLLESCFHHGLLFQFFLSEDIAWELHSCDRFLSMFLLGQENHSHAHTCCGSFPLLTTRSPNMSYNHIFNTTSMMGYKGIQTCREREGERERQTKNKTYFSHPAHQSLSPNHRAKWRPRSSKDFHSWLSQWPNAMRECETCENFPVSSGQGLYKITGFKHVNPCLLIWKFPSLGSNDLLLGPLSKTIIPTSDSGDWWEIVSNDVTQHWGSESHGYGSNFFKKTAARLTWYKVAKPMPTVNPYITIGIVI